MKTRDTAILAAVAALAVFWVGYLIGATECDNAPPSDGFSVQWAPGKPWTRIPLMRTTPPVVYSFTAVPPGIEMNFHQRERCHQYLNNPEILECTPL